MGQPVIYRPVQNIAPISFALRSYADARNLHVGEIFAVGDVTISKNGGAPVNVINLPVSVGSYYTWTPTGAETDAGRVVISVIDQGAKAFEDELIVIETVGVTGLLTGFPGDPTQLIPTSGIIDNSLGWLWSNIRTFLLAPVVSLSANGLDAVVVDTGMQNINGTESLRLMLAALCGRVSGGGTPTIVIRGANNSTARIVATVDENGNRSAVTLSP
jgi:hypothetical protein